MEFHGIELMSAQGGMRSDFTRGGIIAGRAASAIRETPRGGQDRE
jgi:hypothetical protein